METTIEYIDEQERISILESNKDKYLIAEKNIKEGNFLVFTTVKPLEMEVEELKQDKVNNQLALAELLETLIIKGVL